MYLSCSHFTTHGSWPYLPNVIEIGGLHLKDPKDLPKDLETFMDSSPNGVAFVSFGSSLSPSKLPKEKLEIFVEAFSNLELSKNVKISSWLPQQDLLGHPNLKVFVTHGGLGSLVEAIYHKAVIVGIPFSADQRPNLLRAERNGYARMLEWEDLTSANLINGIKDAMNDAYGSLYGENSQTLHGQRKEATGEGSLVG